jgi:glycosyltransferase involved in cell wall biosynthesis
LTKVSVIIPNYNHARYLQKRIESVLSQTYQDFELILLDDCSTDNSRLILEKYRTYSKVSHLIINQINSGSTFRQWQKGIQVAQGEYIWIAESDDYADQHFLEILVPQLEQHSRVGLAYCQSFQVDEQDAILMDLRIMYGERWYYNYHNDGNAEVINYLSIRNNIPNASAVLFRKSLYNKVSTNFLTYTYCGDWVFWIDLLKKSDIIYISQSLNYFRKHKQNTTQVNRKSARMLIEGYKVLNYILKNFQVPPPKKAEILRIWADNLFYKITKEYRKLSKSDLLRLLSIIIKIDLDLPFKITAFFIKKIISKA